ncbi:MAG: tRNA dihydrouridine(20/20a) synthase DusA [Gammaproteobacteria bacterium]|nr:tRNA dihydrouridine(20/20a) synthase DusA [Gammaproteobacteria bacterium]NIR23656.1 tRNA dihydrouridine(20/20a) synthase DusA [Gammaproteobacteria bacterium]NIS05469.1 tRNA dihydrouridine(20/20a) synthase DusA [Gammaproteobacteria bacterium]NIU41853.1 tRNA dihydrouridine(20/20a) synthase DusA [Gammaproteobacteria bacterium]NIV47583.1 tRNA dihydrouridine(20/20a) synthase DusA [Gammaproteobacteria bacterium]
MASIRESAGSHDPRLSVAPMMQRTDRFCRYFLRLITRRTLLYTEMLTSAAVLHGDRDRLLAFDDVEHPVAIQLGGSDPEEMAAAARIAAARGYDEVNMNVGCPSSRVRAGRFGACLMAEPQRVADCVAAMIDAVDIPVTIKTRIGIDHQDSYEALAAFVHGVAERGCKTFIVHARKAWLNGLSPRQNREVPPLRYELVHRLKQDFPGLRIVVNGGIADLDQACRHLACLDGVMIGRAAYRDPFGLARADGAIFGEHRPAPTRRAVLEAYAPYFARERAQGARLVPLIRHLSGLYLGQPGARAWRRALSALAATRDADERDLLRAIPGPADETTGAAAA